MNKHTLYKLEKMSLIVVFCLTIFLSFFIGIIQDDKIVSTLEKRNLNKLPLPPKSLEDYSKYPKEFNAYYSDHFGFREVFTKKYFKLVNKFKNTTSVDDVTMGKDGWMFLGSIKPGYKKFGDPIGDAINVNLYTEKELEDFARYVVGLKDWLAKKGIEYVYVIVPNKHTIYFEKLPDYIKKQNAKSAIDQLVEYLAEHTDVTVIDLRKTLLEAKDKHQIYFKTDTHWNFYGVNVAQFEIMKRIELLFPGQIKPFLLKDNQFKIVSDKSDKIGDLATFAKIKNVKEDIPKPVFEDRCTPVKETPTKKQVETYTMVCDSGKLNAVIFRDSFFGGLRLYASRQFHRSTYIWEKMNYTSLSKYVEQERPDIVIDQVLERDFPYLPPTDFPENIISEP